MFRIINSPLGKRIYSCWIVVEKFNRYCSIGLGELKHVYTFWFLRLYYSLRRYMDKFSELPNVHWCIPLQHIPRECHFVIPHWISNCYFVRLIAPMDFRLHPKLTRGIYKEESLQETPESMTYPRDRCATTAGRGSLPISTMETTSSYFVSSPKPRPPVISTTVSLSLRHIS